MSHLLPHEKFRQYLYAYLKLFQPIPNISYIILFSYIFYLNKGSAVFSKQSRYVIIITDTNHCAFSFCSRSAIRAKKINKIQPQHTLEPNDFVFSFNCLSFEANVRRKKNFYTIRKLRAIKQIAINLPQKRSEMR